MPDAEASFTESMRLLQEAHSDDELALSCMAYGQYLATAQPPGRGRAKLIQAQALMSRCGMAGALEQVRQLLQALPPAATLLQPGQQRVMLARRGVPRGRPLRPDELIEVIWNLEAPAQREVGHAASKATARQADSAAPVRRGQRPGCRANRRRPGRGVGRHAAHRRSRYRRAARRRRGDARWGG